MSASEAIRLIEGINPLISEPQHWADLGCGSGTFTEALSAVLPSYSLIEAVDKSFPLLSSIDSADRNTEIKRHRFDFLNHSWPFKELDGILMANSLHFVKEQHAFIQKTIPLLKKNHRWIIIEYEMKRASTWVPYPLSFEQLSKMMYELGADKVSQLAEYDSLYGNGKMYSALVSFIPTPLPDPSDISPNT